MALKSDTHAVRTLANVLKKPFGKASVACARWRSVMILRDAMWQDRCAKRSRPNRPRDASYAQECSLHARHRIRRIRGAKKRKL